MASRKAGLLPAEIIAVLGHDFGGSIELQPLSEGMESQAFAFVADGQEFVVRVNRDDAGFAKDAFAWRHFAGPDLPVPEILAITHKSDIALCVSRRAPGVTLQDVDSRRLPSLLEPVATVLDAMAAADISLITGAGPFDPQGRGAFADWPSYIAAIADEQRYAWRKVERKAAMAAIRPLLAHIMPFAAACPGRRCLIHGDFGSNNVLVSADSVTGVIDWSEAMVGDPLYDIANILFWRPWLACMEEQARFFETIQPERLREKSLLAGYQLRIGLENIHQAAIAGDHADFTWALARSQAVAREAGLQD